MADEIESKQSPISKIPVFLAGAGLGLLACYMLDPQHGKGRRAKLRDQGSKGLRSGWRSVLHRLTGFVSDFAHRGPSLAQVTEALEKTPVATLAKKAQAETDHLSH